MSDDLWQDRAMVLPWLKGRWEYLLELKAQNRFPHALLINGPEGIGKACFAMALANYVLCREPHNGAACGHCRSCELTGSGGHPDLYQLKPDEPGKPIKIDQIRELTAFIYSTAQQGGYRVVIIDPADSMNINASNALLKMLEEPGSNTLIMLLTHRLGQMLPTIKSRCQRVDMPPADVSLATQWVSTQLEVAPEEAAQLLVIAHNSPLQALAYKQDDLLGLRAKVLKGLADILKERSSSVEVAQSLYREDLELLLGWIYSWVVDIARSAENQADPDLLRHTDAHNMLLALARKVGHRKLYAFADQVQAARKDLMFRRNPNKQLLMETLLNEWHSLPRPD
ncbi:DNA polymerase III subunit delta' [Amphritea sp. 2_MG-2023]|uniref:DNA polymerase III subunit delta' n=1 Tax=Amphritea TaxID=515417 RepID=UPI001C06C3D9|nr:DNA polymerase III subunit delta' [Amphritea sp. 2_MG-2023]MBU2966675.1 DNA polymerase III subunit delta' [Amphritea atlantica]MDO6417466.1 DNA polymerase III subunit delta' [Amphritea sp. 2_MG-2023]